VPIRLNTISLLLSAAVSTAAFAQPAQAPAGKSPTGSPVGAAQKPAAPDDNPGAEPQSTTATFGDWTLRCQLSGQDAGRQRICEVAQTVQSEGQQGALAQIAVGRVAPKDPLKVTVLVGNNILIPGQLRMAVDEKDVQPLDLAWRRCAPAGCVGDGDIRDDILRNWRAQTGRGLIQIKDGAGRDIVLPFSFRGLAPALDRLAKG
jgi:invasion protein IalB